jgi:hypothetical protein
MRCERIRPRTDDRFLRRAKVASIWKGNVVHWNTVLEQFCECDGREPTHEISRKKRRAKHIKCLALARPRGGKGDARFSLRSFSRI